MTKSTNTLLDHVNQNPVFKRTMIDVTMPFHIHTNRDEMFIIL